MDFNFLVWQDETFDLVWSRHTLEHSPFPLITLMEWRRVTKATGFLALIMPAPEPEGFWTVHGRNHYSVLPKENVEWLLRRAGWHILQFDNSLTNHHPRFLDHSALTKDQKRNILKEEPRVIENRWLCKAALEIRT